VKALIVGAGGQLGRALSATAPAGAVISSYGADRLDITDSREVAATVAAARPSLIFNAAAYTAVDQAESESDAAYAVNTVAVGNLADAARRAGAKLVHVSTDFVFDGRSGTPYAPDAPTAPLSVYGRTKLDGERLAGDDALIVRTAWIYGVEGRNFVHTMVRMMREKAQVRVVADQIGSPTWVPGLARALWAMAARDARGIYHYTDSGVASWYDFAVAIQEEALAIGLLDRTVPIIPITTADFPTPARRPPYSVLDKTRTWALLGEAAPHWRAQLRVMLNEVKRNG
jgi:dTDP-4-dehydrorhamnose reductase